MKNLKIILLSTVAILLLSGCCLIDYRPTIEKIANPALKELKIFYKSKKHFPNIKERDVMLEKAGCEMKGNICMFDGNELLITKPSRNNHDKYRMRISYMNTEKSNSYASCGFGMRKDGTPSDFVMCSKRPCITISH